MEKLDDVEAVTMSAVNTSRECGKEVANKTVIAMGLKRTVELLINKITKINEEKDTSLIIKDPVNITEMDIVNITKVDPVNTTNMDPGKIKEKQKIRQNRLQMYGVTITIIICKNLLKIKVYFQLNLQHHNWSQWVDGEAGLSE